MSPVRHEDDFRSRPIKSWSSWVDQAIEEARERGEFDGLPGHGKPLKIETNAYAPEMNLAYSTLKNAGYAPTWMELDRKITAGRDDLDSVLERSVTFLSTLRTQVIARETNAARPTPAAREPARKGGKIRALWRSLVSSLDFAKAPAQRQEERLPAPGDLDAIRLRMREQYLERAAELDKVIAEFHAALPRDLWHLERMRLTEDAAGRRFDDAMATSEPQPVPERSRIGDSWARVAVLSVPSFRVGRRVSER